MALAVEFVMALAVEFVMELALEFVMAFGIGICDGLWHWNL